MRKYVLLKIEIVEIFGIAPGRHSAQPWSAFRPY